MRRTLPFVALWFAAGALAVVIASAGVAVVDDQLTASRPAPLSAEEVRDRLQAAGSTSTILEDGTTTSTTARPPGTTSTTSAPATTERTDGAGTGGSPTPTTTAPAAVTRTYELVGGTTTIRFAPNGISVLSAAPKPGFTAEVEPEGSGVKVEFESESHQSRIDAWWASGPQTRVREDADG